MPKSAALSLFFAAACHSTTITNYVTTTGAGDPDMEETTGDEGDPDEEDTSTSTGGDTSSTSGNLADTGSTSTDTSTSTSDDTTSTGVDETTDESTSSTTSTGDETSTTTGEPDPCGNGVIDADEQCDGATPHPSVGCSDTCTYDFGAVPQMYCGGTCSWAGANGCDQADADVFCRLRTSNPDAHATAFELGAPTDQPGFACADPDAALDPDTRINLGPAAGVDTVLYVADLQGSHGGGPTSTIVAVTCE